MRLSNDYSPFGKFSTQILLITIFLMIPPVVTGIMLGGLVNPIFFLLLIGLIAPIWFFRWGMHKQDIELFGEHK